jgi:hypothetical protein
MSRLASSKVGCATARSTAQSRSCGEPLSSSSGFAGSAGTLRCTLRVRSIAAAAAAQRAETPEG